MHGMCALSNQNGKPRTWFPVCRGEATCTPPKKTTARRNSDEEPAPLRILRSDQLKYTDFEMKLEEEPRHCAVMPEYLVVIVTRGAWGLFLPLEK